jgi:hypothetical protein
MYASYFSKAVDGMIHVKYIVTPQLNLVFSSQFPFTSPEFLPQFPIFDNSQEDQSFPFLNCTNRWTAAVMGAFLQWENATD